MGIFRRPCSASLGDTPKPHSKGEKRAAPSPPQERTPKRGKGGPSPSYVFFEKITLFIKKLVICVHNLEKMRRLYLIETKDLFELNNIFFNSNKISGLNKYWFKINKFLP